MIWKLLHRFFGWHFVRVKNQWTGEVTLTTKTPHSEQYALAGCEGPFRGERLRLYPKGNTSHQLCTWVFLVDQGGKG